MARLLDSVLRLDAAARMAEKVIGTRSDRGRELHAALTQLRRDLAPAVLHQIAAAGAFDPKTDLMEILALAEVAGLSWPDLAHALNHYHERHPGSC